MVVHAVRVLMLILIIGPTVATAQQSLTPFQAFIKQQAKQLRQNDRAPQSLEEWQRRRTELRGKLIHALGVFPQVDCELEPRVLGEFPREGYRVQKLVFQTRPGIWMTANAYVPDLPGKRPAILHVHGHWAGAKQDPVVQSRCIGCAKLGYFVLSVDAFGAGERGVDKPLGEYHGEMTAATLYPVGLPLSGLQVYENKRAVDYLLTRPEVDSQHIGITGASGGGNQTMYAGALDERLGCVVPTCSVGNYQAYLSAACCLCEVVPGALQFTEEGDVLGLAANRGLMVTSATQDAFQFSVAEAKKSFARLEDLVAYYPGSRIKHTIIESPHAYNQPMREAMYGWMALHLRGEGDGSPIADPVIVPEEPELLRCYPGNSRPDDFVTLPRFAAAEAARLTALRVGPANRDDWDKYRREQLRRLVALFGGVPDPSPIKVEIENQAGDTAQLLKFETEPGLSIAVRRDLPERPGRLAIVLDLDQGADKAWSSEPTQKLRDNGWTIVTPELRATGQYADPRDRVHFAPDHNTAEWSLWIGRPLLGQWVHDIRRTLDAIAQRDGSLPHDVLITGSRSSAVVALCAAALDERITRAQVADCLATYVTDQPYRDLRLGIMVPGLLRDVGDVADLAALVAPRAVTIRGGVSGGGEQLDAAALAAQFAPARKLFELVKVPELLVIE